LGASQFNQALVVIFKI